MIYFNDEKLGHVRGPFTVSALKALISIGSIESLTLVRIDNGPWTTFSSSSVGFEASELSNASELPRGSRLSIDDIPEGESTLCTSCPSWKCCDVTFLWDRLEGMWVTWEEYETLEKVKAGECFIDVKSSKEEDDVLATFNAEIEVLTEAAEEEPQHDEGNQFEQSILNQESVPPRARKRKAEKSKKIKNSKNNQTPVNDDLLKKPGNLLSGGWDDFLDEQSSDDELVVRTVSE